MAKAAIDAVEVADLTVDGQVFHIGPGSRYRTGLVLADFTIYSADNLYSWIPLEPGTYPTVEDGYYAMLAPLSAGSHTITIHGKSNEPFVFELIVTYHLTVK